MKKIFLPLFVFFILLGSTSFSQLLLLQENFDYGEGTLLSADGWSAHSGIGTNSPAIVTPGLTYGGYLGSGIGNAAFINNAGGEDVSRDYPTQNTDAATMYTSLLVNVSDASALKAGDYFFHIGYRAAPATFTMFCARLYAKITAAGVVNFGISNASTAGTQVYSPVDYATNTTYLIIIKYKINQAGADTVAFWVKATGVPADEASAGVPDGLQETVNGQDSVNAVALRQGSSSNSVAVIVDGIRISNTWAAIVPVELSSFTANAVNKNVQLNWSTATETNNSGFEVVRDGSKIAFVAGVGTSTEINNYAYTDKNVAVGSHSYQLVQIDLDGTRSIVASTEVNVANVVTKFGMEQNYPNPFNPSTKISYSVPQSGNVKIEVFNTIGQSVALLVNGFNEAGTH